MNIAIVGYFNPKCISEYLFENDIPLINEAATAVNTLVVSLLQAGHYVKVFTSYHDVGEKRILEGKNVKIYMISDLPKIKKFGFFSRVYMVGRLKNLMRGEIDDVDVIHAHWTYDFALAAKSFAEKKPVFCTVRDWCPYILSMQTSLRAKIIWEISYLIFRRVMKGDNIKFIANSHYTYDRIIKDYPDKQVAILPNPINSSLILTEKINPNIRHKFISIAQSLDDKRKNISVLLQAFEKYLGVYPDAQLRLVGNYNGDRTYKNVTFTGAVSHDKIISLIDESFCLVHPSKEETFGNILLEAMARRVPCIGGNSSGAVPKVLGDGKCGVLCNIDDSNALCDAMLKINDDVYRNNLVDNATEMINSKYRSDVIAEKHILLYEKGLSHHS